MTYVLGNQSLSHLTGVHPDMVRVVKRAIGLTTQDFGVYEGLRTTQRQAQYVASGVSKTMASKHLRQINTGFGHAVDLVPWIDWTYRWEWPAIYPIASAMRQAAIEEGVELRWGGVWDRKFNLLQADASGLKAEVAAYCKRHPGPDFLDGPHYELA